MKRGEPSRHEYERHATLVTLLQIMLGAPSGGDTQQWGQPGQPSLHDKCLALREDEQLKVHEGQNNLLAQLVHLFGTIAYDLSKLPSYESIRQALESAHAEFRNWSDPSVTSARQVSINGVDKDRGAWQAGLTVMIKTWLAALEKNEYLTFKMNGSYGTCKVQLMDVLKEFRNSFGEAGGHMDRKAMFAKARDISDLLLIHLLRRRQAKGQPPPQPPKTLNELLGASSRDPWFYKCLKLVEADAQQQPPPTWLKPPSPWANAAGVGAGASAGVVKKSHLIRLCNALKHLHEVANDAHHGATAHASFTASYSDVQTRLIDPLHEIFREDRGRKNDPAWDPRGVHDRKTRILM